MFYFAGDISTDSLDFNTVSLKNSDSSPSEAVALNEPIPIIRNFENHKEIFVDKINGIHWDSFVTSLYRKSRNNVITGKILTVKSLNKY